MRKKRAQAIRQEEMQKPEGMSSGTYRAAKRRYSRGYNRMSQPNPVEPYKRSGFPANNVQEIKTWREKTGIDRIIGTEAVDKDNGRRKVAARVIYKRKKVTRVISRPKKKEHEKKG